MTKESIDKVRRILEELPLRQGWARVCCLGCGQNEIVPAGNEEEPHERMKRHARSHEDELDLELQHHGTEYLVVTFTYALPVETA